MAVRKREFWWSELTSSAPAHEAEVVEAGHLVLHHRGGVPQLGRVVLVVPGHHGDQGPVRNVAEGHDLRGGRQASDGSVTPNAHSTRA